MRVAAHPHGHDFDERRSMPLTCPVSRPGEGRGNRVGIGAVRGDTGDAVADCLVRKRAHRRLLANRRRERRLIVLDAEHRRQPPRGAQVYRFVPLAERRTAVADERERHAAAAFTHERHRHARDRQRADSERSRRRQDAPAQIADVQILAVHRRAGLGGLRAQHHPHGIRVTSHRQGDAKVADHRTNDISTPVSCFVAPRGAAAQTDRSRVDRLLPERPETFALKGNALIADLAAGKELLQAVVYRARQHHATEDLAAFVRRQRGGDGFAGEKAGARVDQFVCRLLQALTCGHTRRRVRNVADVDPLEFLAERREKRLRRLRARRRSRTQRGTNRLDGDGVAIEHERTEALRQRRRCRSRSTRHIEMGIVGRWDLGGIWDLGLGFDVRPL